MDINEYQRLAMRTRPLNLSSDDLRLNAAMGMVGESGEVMDHLKKAMFQGHELSKEKLIEETGDILWYCAEMADALGITLDEIAAYNVVKLKKRYPDGFDKEKSVNRGC